MIGQKLVNATSQQKEKKIFTGKVGFLKLWLDPVGNMKAGSLLDKS